MSIQGHMREMLAINRWFLEHLDRQELKEANELLKTAHEKLNLLEDIYVLWPEIEAGWGHVGVFWYIMQPTDQGVSAHNERRLIQKDKFNPEAYVEFDLALHKTTAMNMAKMFVESDFDLRGFMNEVGCRVAS